MKKIIREVVRRTSQRLSQKGKKALLILSIALAFVISVIDALPGPEVTFSVFYVLPIFIAGYYVGLLAGISISLLCVVISLLADTAFGVTYSTPAIPYWNAAVRLLFFWIVLYLLENKRVAEEQLMRSEERFRMLVDGVKDYAIVLLDKEGKIKSWNPGAERIYGYQSEEIVGLHFSCFYSADAVALRKPESHLRLAEEQGRFTEEAWRIRKDDQPFWADTILAPLTKGGKYFEGFSFLTRDITEKKQAEEAVRVFAHLHEIDRTILAADSSDELAEHALRRLNELIAFEVGTVCLFDQATGQSRRIACVPPDQTGDLSSAFVLEENETALLSAGEVYFVPNRSEHAGGGLFLESFPHDGFSSYAIIPLLSRDKLVGSINLGLSSSADFDEKHLDIVREVSKQMSLALHSSSLFEELRTAHQRLQMLSQRILQIQENERHHLARELHDEMGQSLTVLRLHLEELKAVAGNSAVQDRLEESVNIVEQILQQARHLSLDLRPLILDDLGLAAALRWYVSRKAQLAGLTVSFDGDVSTPLPAEIETACFRIAQEALTNIVRHANARRVNILLRVEAEELELCVKDDGIGFDLETAQQKAMERQSLGLLGIRERAALLGGEVEIESFPSCGTQIHVRFPLEIKEQQTRV